MHTLRVAYRLILKKNLSRGCAERFFTYWGLLGLLGLLVLLISSWFAKYGCFTTKKYVTWKVFVVIPIFLSIYDEIISWRQNIGHYPSRLSRFFYKSVLFTVSAVCSSVNLAIISYFFVANMSKNGQSRRKIQKFRFSHLQTTKETANSQSLHFFYLLNAIIFSSFSTNS